MTTSIQAKASSKTVTVTNLLKYPDVPYDPITLVRPPTDDRMYKDQRQNDFIFEVWKFVKEAELPRQAVCDLKYNVLLDMRVAYASTRLGCVVSIMMKDYHIRLPTPLARSFSI